MARYAKLANYMIVLDALAIKFFECVRSVMLLIKNTILFGFVFVILKDAFKLDNTVFTLVKNINESIILIMILVLITKIVTILTITHYDFDEAMDNILIDSKSIIQTILYKLVPIGLASQIALETNKSQLISNFNGLVINFLFVLLVIKLSNVIISKISQNIIYDFEYMFNKRINQITVDEYDKLKFVDVIDRTIHKMYKSGQTIDTYRLKLFKLITLNITDYGLRTIEQQAFIARPAMIARCVSNSFTKIKLI